MDRNSSIFFDHDSNEQAMLQAKDEKHESASLPTQQLSTGRLSRMIQIGFLTRPGTFTMLQIRTHRRVPSVMYSYVPWSKGAWSCSVCSKPIMVVIHLGSVTIPEKNGNFDHVQPNPTSSGHDHGTSLLIGSLSDLCVQKEMVMALLPTFTPAV